MPIKLVVANKAYSSWSFRPWILLKTFKIPFEDVVIPMRQPDSREKMLAYAPTGKCPSLHDGDIGVWESLAIIDYVAETFPGKAIWPKGKAARAHARSLAAEMHGGFQALRNEAPTNFRRAPKKIDLTPAALADIARIEAAWAEARQRFGRGGPFLFGTFSATDAMFAPVVSRFHAYDVEVSAATRAYMDAIMSLPAWQEWRRDADAELWRIDDYENV